MALLSIFSEVDFLSPDLELVLVCLPLSNIFMLSERYIDDYPSLIGKVELLRSSNKRFCFRFEIVTPCSPLEDIEDRSGSMGKMSPSKYSIYFLESYSSRAAE
jgi:hypothetical protein